MIKLGFSLSPQMLLDNPENERSATLYSHFGNITLLLKELKDQGITSIEIRNLPRQTDVEVSAHIIHKIWDAGLEVSVHGATTGDMQGNMFADIYPAIKELIMHSGSYQSKIMMPIHALSSKEDNIENLSHETIELFKNWSSIIEIEEIPLEFAIELTRKKSTRVDPSNTIQGVVDTVSKINDSHVGITWDMGHYYSNLINNAQCSLESLPSINFLKKVVHTHIHGLGVMGTHCPLEERDSLPLEKYVEALKNCGYEGIYNLEFGFKRFPHDKYIIKHVFSSIERLRNCVDEQ